MAIITHVDIRMVDLKPKVVRQDAIQSFVSQETPIIRIFDADGVCGTGYSYTIGTGGSSVVALLRDHLAPQLIGRDAHDIEAIWRDLLFSTHATAVGAITSLALAAIDTALWDLQSRKTGIPLYQLAGGAKGKIPLYTTEGGWLQLETSQLVDDALAMKQQGFGGAKIKVGKPRAAEDVARLQAVREAVGHDFEIMTDANQGFDLSEAIRRARLFEAFDIAWFEEPLPADNVLAHQRLAAATTLPVAVGESMYSLGQFREYLALSACSIVQVDVARIGGITPWLKVAHLAESFDVAVCPHFLMELHVALCCAVPNSRWLEYIPQLDSLTHQGLRIENGHALPSDAPGLGIDWDWDAIAAGQLFTPIVIGK
ncbi:mandelate racemase/muconate lactonizing enzyme family protein [Thalassospira marina]|uniref:Mandelate racemase n=1 Tax=Thalassospira marina TaxID=2048283 RepID=A0ABM6QG39_9PROT|nr:mandelate racemase/muconate lactonizing enzyme family protein [Thalassospira marina]AUG55534.1 mandelate racemase [Thalassospira marina]